MMCLRTLIDAGSSLIICVGGFDDVFTYINLSFGFLYGLCVLTERERK